MLNKGEPATFREKGAEVNKMEVQTPSVPIKAVYAQEYLEGINPKKAVNVFCIFFRK